MAKKGNGKEIIEPLMVKRKLFKCKKFCGMDKGAYVKGTIFLVSSFAFFLVRAFVELKNCF